MREWGTTPNGVFGAKIMWAHLEDLGRRLDSHDLPALVDTVFDRPRLVWVRRADTVRQAVSLWRAMQTQSWRAENEPDAGEPQYSFAALRHLVELLTAHDAAWERFFAATGSDVLTFSYEDVAPTSRACSRARSTTSAWRRPTARSTRCRACAARPTSAPTRGRPRTRATPRWRRASARPYYPGREATAVCSSRSSG